MSADNITPIGAAEPPQPSTKRRPGRVQTVSNNTSALTEGDLARAQAANVHRERAEKVAKALASSLCEELAHE